MPSSKGERRKPLPRVLGRVTRAAAAKDAAELEYRAAIRAAADAGYSYVEIGEAAGITRQAARLHGRTGAKP